MFVAKKSSWDKSSFLDDMLDESLAILAELEEAEGSWVIESFLRRLPADIRRDILRHVELLQSLERLKRAQGWFLGSGVECDIPVIQPLAVDAECIQRAVQELKRFCEIPDWMRVLGKLTLALFVPQLRVDLSGVVQ